MRNLTFFITLFICLFSFAFAKTETLKLTREDAVKCALARNHNLKAVKIGIDAARGRNENVGLWANPELSAEYGNDMAFKNEGEYGMKFEISQRFPLFGRLSKEKAVGEIDIALAEAEFANEVRILSNEVEIAYIEIVQKSVEINLKKSLLAELVKLENETSEAFKRAEVSSIELARVKGERVKLGVEILDDEVALESSINAFKILLALAPDTDVEFSENLKELPVSTLGYSLEVLESRPDWRMFDLASKSADAQVALEKAGRYEDISVGVFYESTYEEDSPIGKKKERAMGVAVSIPLPFNTKTGAINEKLALRRQAEAKALAVENKIKNEISLYKYGAQKYSSILANQSVELELASRKIYEQTLFSRNAAQASISDLIDAWKTSLDVALVKTSLVGKQAKNAIMLNYSLGLSK